MKESSTKEGKGKAASARTLEKGLRILEAVEKAGRPVTIQEVTRTTGIQRLAVYRLLSTLEERGYVYRSADKRYHALIVRRRLLAGYAAPLSGTPFRQEVAASIKRAASQSGFELMMLHNEEDDAATAMRNIEALLERRADVVMFFQPVETLGHMMADRLFGAGVRFITIESPIQGGIYFGANNYQAGRLAGIALGNFARDKWRGRFDSVVLLEGTRAGTNAQARLAGALVGVREVLGELAQSHVIHLDGHARQESSRAAMANLIRTLRPGTRLLVSGFNDPSSVGAAEAVRAEGREADIAIVSQNATSEGRAEIRKPGSCLFASVAYFPERYGEKLLEMAWALALADPLPPAVYTEHVLLNRDNVDQFYPEPLVRA
ncbi:MAG: hypothetical protein EHM23_17890 [Acidobacteria bacterium]|nr:MAG: hypothetical protein EHM23_17890 [Acidobacteriota bacterium]